MDAQSPALSIALGVGERFANASSPSLCHGFSRSASSPALEHPFQNVDLVTPPRRLPGFARGRGTRTPVRKKWTHARISDDEVCCLVVIVLAVHDIPASNSPLAVYRLSGMRPFFQNAVLGAEAARLPPFGNHVHTMASWGRGVGAVFSLRAARLRRFMLSRGQAPGVTVMLCKRSGGAQQENRASRLRPFW